jgi:hypothetical protein
MSVRQNRKANRRMMQLWKREFLIARWLSYL